MAGFNSKSDSKPQDSKNLKQSPNQGQINQVSNKGKTLGAQHASHGDGGTEKGSGSKSKGK